MEMNIEEYSNDVFVKFVLMFLNEFRFIQIFNDDNRDVLKFRKHLSRTDPNFNRMELHLNIHRIGQGNYKANLFIVVGDEDVDLLVDARNIAGFSRFVIPKIIEYLTDY